MARFLHVADIHLGFDRYDNRTRTQDFFLAFYDLLQRYAVEEAVDFVLIAGDLFEHRTIQPSTLNQAQLCLNLLNDAHIPVIAIEGNHDNRPYGTKTSWLRYLADWGLVIFLEPGDQDGEASLLVPWDPEQRYGSYIDLDCDVRIIGTHWYGAVAPQAIQQVSSAIDALPPGPSQTIALFHHGLEGHVSRYAGALRYDELLPLKTAGVDYLALGHIHKSYAVEGWIFNPGSVEANSVEESLYERGAYLVNLEQGRVQANLCTDYAQRSIRRLQIKLQGHEVLEAVESAALDCVKGAIADHIFEPDEQPIIELRITGVVGFERLDLDTRKLQHQLKEESGALIFLLRYDVDSVNYQSPLSDDEDQLHIEEEIYQDIVASHALYRHHTNRIAKGLCDLKELQLDGQGEPELYGFVEHLLTTSASSDESNSSTSSLDVRAPEEELTSQ